jgi:hypothetical protein
MRDASELLKQMEGTVETLQGLVRRRGHTNDPTEEIQTTMAHFEADAKELALSLTTMTARISSSGSGRNKSNQQRKRHYELVVAGMQQRGADITQQFKASLELRSQVIRDQAQRRRLLNPSRTTPQPTIHTTSGNSSISSVSKPSSLPPLMKPMTTGSKYNPMDSPLFTMTNNQTASHPSRGIQSAPSSSSRRQQHLLQPNHNNPRQTPSSNPLYPPSATAATATANTKAPSSGPMTSGSVVGGGYGGTTSSHNTNGSGYGGYYGGGYGGGMHGNGNGSRMDMGMRQRRTGAPTNNTNGMQQQHPYNPNGEEGQQQQQEQQQQDQVQVRRQRRETRGRLESARAAEQSIAALGTVFSKMSTLISTQHEMVDKIEDDVEAAHGHVEAGQEELVTLYHITKGNRGLILKIFAILIFFLIFMKLY